jgi:large subunit ribosomal protein L4
MAQATLYSKTGAKKETAAKLSPKVFAVEQNHELMSLAYNIYMGNGRAASAKTLTRGEVRGGGKKPWKQKGTGRARAGGTRLPHWTGGGVAFGPTGEQNYTRALPVKAKRAAIRQGLSAQAADKRIIILEAFDGGEGKVRPTAELLTKLNLDGRVVLVVADKTPLIDRATRNIPQVDVVTAQYLNIALILNADWIVMTSEAQEAVTKWLEA